MGATAQLFATWDWPAVETVGASGPVDFVLVCEHASAFIPPPLRHLGLSPAARDAHIAWDPGARALADALCDRLSARLVAGRLSRLVYDCNRGLDAPDCIVSLSDRIAVPGNQGLSAQDRQMRHDLVHDPFHAAVEAALEAAGPGVVLVTIHSFTPVFGGVPRSVEIGFLWHGDDDALARAALAEEHALGRREAAANAPYSAKDGVTYTLARHGTARGLPNVMIEVRNDLLATAAEVEALADDLARGLVTARQAVLA